MRSYTRGKEPGGHHNIDLVMGRSRCGSSPRTVAWWWHDDGVGRLHWTGGTGDASGSFSEVLWTSLTCSQGRRKDCESQRWRPLGQKMGDAMSPQVKKDLAGEGGGSVDTRHCLKYAHGRGWKGTTNWAWGVACAGVAAQRGQWPTEHRGEAVVDWRAVD
jgi:hypothetical protein